MALLRARSDRSRALNWIQNGSGGRSDDRTAVGGALRTANFRLHCSGQAEISTRDYLAELPSLIDEIDNGGLAVTARSIPLAAVETVWTAPEVPGVRSVLVL